MTVPDSAAFSRSSNSAFGKCDDSLDVPVPGDLKALLTMLAVFDGKPTATYAREILEQHAILERERVKRIMLFHGDLDNPEKVG